MGFLFLLLLEASHTADSEISADVWDRTHSDGDGDKGYARGQHRGDHT